KNAALRPGGVGVVHHEPLASSQAGLEKGALAVARPEQVQADANVGIEEAFAVERGLARALYAHEDHGFHGAAAPVAIQRIIVSRSMASRHWSRPCRHPG